MDPQEKKHIFSQMLQDSQDDYQFKKKQPSLKEQVVICLNSTQKYRDFKTRITYNTRIQSLKQVGLTRFKKRPSLVSTHSHLRRMTAPLLVFPGLMLGNFISLGGNSESQNTMSLSFQVTQVSTTLKYKIKQKENDFCLKYH